MPQQTPANGPAGVGTGTGADARRERWRGHREARRAQLVDAAIRAIRARGPGVGMGDIAAEAGVTKPVLYRMFTDKADLYLAVGRRVAGDYLARLQPALSELEHADSGEKIRAVVDSYLAVVEEEPQLYRFVVQQQGLERRPEQDLVGDCVALIGNAVARIIGDRARAHGLDAGAAEPWGHGLVGLVQSTADWWITRGRPIGRAALTEYLTRLIWNGLAGSLGAAVAHTATPGQPVAPGPPGTAEPPGAGALPATGHPGGPDRVTRLRR